MGTSDQNTPSEKKPIENQEVVKNTKPQTTHNRPNRIQKTTQPIIAAPVLHPSQYYP